MELNAESEDLTLNASEIGLVDVVTQSPQYLTDGTNRLTDGTNLLYAFTGVIASSILLNADAVDDTENVE